MQLFHQKQGQPPMKNAQNLEGEGFLVPTKTFGHWKVVILSSPKRIFDDFASALRKPLHTFFFSFASDSINSEPISGMKPGPDWGFSEIRPSLRGDISELKTS